MRTVMHACVKLHNMMVEEGRTLVELRKDTTENKIRVSEDVEVWQLFPFCPEKSYRTLTTGLGQEEWAHIRLEDFFLPLLQRVAFIEYRLRIF